MTDKGRLYLTEMEVVIERNGRKYYQKYPLMGEGEELQAGTLCDRLESIARHIRNAELPVVK